MNTTLARISIAQTNPAVGDIAANAENIIAAVNQARRLGSDLIVFPQLALSGAPLRDHLRKSSFFAALHAELQRVIQSCQGITAIVGLPCADENSVYNCAALIHDAQLVDIICKQTVSDRPYFHESAYFTAAEPAQPTFYKIGELSIAVVLGEDLGHHLYRGNHSTSVAHVLSTDPHLVVNMTAHPYTPSGVEIRQRYLKEISLRNGCAIAEVNLVGAQDEIVFEGGSQLYSSEGLLLQRAPTFETALLTYDLLKEHTVPHFRDYKPTYGVNYSSLVLPILSQDVKAPLAVIPPYEDPDPREKTIQAIVLGLRDYMRKNGFKDVVLGISGGLDSALVAALAVRALGAEHVHGVAMPSCYNASISLEDSEKLCANLGMELKVISIEKPRQVFDELLAETFKDCRPDTTEENLQARIRANILMALSNKFGWIVLCTGNKSETACGYSTLYGDGAGGIAPIKDVYKTEAFELCRYLNREKEIIPERIITRPPSAELRPDQKDSDSLPDYAVLDAILQLYLEQLLTPEQIIEQGFEEAAVRRVVRLVRISEFKRKQGPFGLRLSTTLFGCDYDMPVTNRFAE